jgi:hypothetical protein
VKKYKEMAGKFFNEKVVAEFPNWTVQGADVSTGQVSLTNDTVDVSVVYDENDNAFNLTSIKIKTGARPIGNDSLTNLCDSLDKGVRLEDNS